MRIVNALLAGLVTMLTIFLPGIYMPSKMAEVYVAASGLTVATGQVVTISSAATYAGITVKPGGELRFAPGSSVTLTSTGNVIISGTLTMKPSTPSIVHTLRFSGVNEANYVGGGMVPLSTDVGLWVVGSGKLDIAGSVKTAWTHAASNIAANASQVTLSSAPAGWRIGDVISIAPTRAITVGTASYTGFDERTITAINGAIVTLSSPTTRAHPIAIDPFTGAIYTAEVLNLTRNVRIEGTGDGGPSFVTNHRAHIFIHSTQAQSIRYAQLRYLGPRKLSEGGYTQSILGRYGLHFHMAGDGSRGSIAEGVVLRDIGAHAFVPHASDGITLRDGITYNTYDDAIWWDAPACTNCDRPGGGPDINDTHDLTITHTIVARVLADKPSQGFRLAGYTLHRGTNLSLRDSVAVGVQGSSDATGFGWPEQGQAVWNFDGNLAHNNAVNGIFVWQNTTDIHNIINFTAYNNGNAGVLNGAYQNRYQYASVTLFGNLYDFDVHAVSNLAFRLDGYGQALDEVRAYTTFHVGEHVLAGGTILVKNCVVGRVLVDELAGKAASKIDFVRCTKLDGSALGPSDFTITRAMAASRFRIQQPNGTTYQIMGDGTVTTIAPFYAGVIP